MRGRKPHPTELKFLRGNPGRRPLNHREPKHPAIDGDDIPGALLADNDIARGALAEWKRIVDTLSRGHVATVDRPTLMAYCLKVGQWQALEAEASAAKFIVHAPSGYPMPNPLIAMANRALALMLRAAAELGLTPSSRSRVVLAPHEEPKGGAVDDFTAFQRKRRIGGAT